MHRALSGNLLSGESCRRSFDAIKILCPYLCSNALLLLRLTIKGGFDRLCLNYASIVPENAATGDKAQESGRLVLGAKKEGLLRLTFSRNF